MKIIYIAGPYRAATPWEVECNIRRAEELSLRVALLGAMPLCPHTMARYFDKQSTDTFWLKGTTELLRRCDAAVFTTNWKESEGCRHEHEEARRRGMSCFFDQGVPGMQSLEVWLNSQS